MEHAPQRLCAVQFLLAIHPNDPSGPARARSARKIGHLPPAPDAVAQRAGGAMCCLTTSRHRPDVQPLFYVVLHDRNGFRFKFSGIKCLGTPTESNGRGSACRGAAGCPVSLKIANERSPTRFINTFSAFNHWFMCLWPQGDDFTAPPPDLWAPTTSNTITIVTIGRLEFRCPVYRSSV